MFTKSVDQTLEIWPRIGPGNQMVIADTLSQACAPDNRGCRPWVWAFSSVWLEFSEQRRSYENTRSYEKWHRIFAAVWTHLLWIAWVHKKPVNFLDPVSQKNTRSRIPGRWRRTRRWSFGHSRKFSQWMYEETSFIASRCKNGSIRLSKELFY